MKIFGYLKERGLKRAIQVIYQYKIELVLEKIIYIFTHNKPLKNIIMIESHNDFDCNGGAFYDYLIRNGYNKKYKIVWFVRKSVKRELPENVKTVKLYSPGFRKAYYMCMAKYFTFDCEFSGKVREDQVAVFCSHGAGALKNLKGKCSVSPNTDYILTQSERYAPIQAEQWSVSYPDKRLVYIGYPSQDVFFNGDESEIKKITDKNYEKIITWMPTFRKGGGYNRNDSRKEQKLGIPLIETIDEYDELNKYLFEMKLLLIIKIHPKQDLSGLGIFDLSNIRVLTGETVKKLNIDSYRLMKCSDALISDYSGAAYDYLQLDRPIAYVLDDMEEYQLGFVVPDIHELIAGHEIYTLRDLYNFVSDVEKGRDVYCGKRKKIRDYIYQYHDGHACERLAKLLGL